ncbi:hypothetical protein [Egbenema bharatensis]|uniref:hypothetical protein n=1 Tax=Egbenema bharatensis TaxID=3463334 RepID=UPI003A8814D7
MQKLDLVASGAATIIEGRTSRKRMIELQRKLHSEGKPYRAFDVYNLGHYERQWWPKGRL